MIEEHSHNYFMSEALKEAKIALSEGNWPIGAVLVVDDQIIARAHNTVHLNQNKIEHAELTVLRLAGNLLHDGNHSATLYSTYEPCPMCLGAILVNHVDTIVCGPDLDGSGSLSLIPLLPEKFHQKKYQLECIQDILMDECIDISLQGIPPEKLSFNRLKKYSISLNNIERQ